MAARVQQYVRERRPHLARFPQHVKVESLGQHSATATEHSVHGARQACPERHHAAAEGTPVGCFHHQMRMRRLKRVVHEAEVTALARCCEAALERVHERDGAQ